MLYVIESEGMKYLVASSIGIDHYNEVTRKLLYGNKVEEVSDIVAILNPELLKFNSNIFSLLSDDIGHEYVITPIEDASRYHLSMTRQQEIDKYLDSMSDKTAAQILNIDKIDPFDRRTESQILIDSNTKKTIMMIEEMQNHRKAQQEALLEQGVDSVKMSDDEIAAATKKISEGYSAADIQKLFEDGELAKQEDDTDATNVATMNTQIGNVSISGVVQQPTTPATPIDETVDTEEPADNNAIFVFANNRRRKEDYIEIECKWWGHNLTGDELQEFVTTNITQNEKVTNDMVVGKMPYMRIKLKDEPKFSYKVEYHFLIDSVSAADPTSYAIAQNELNQKFVDDLKNSTTGDDDTDDSTDDSDQVDVDGDF